MNRTYDFMIIYQDVDGSQIDREFKSMTVPRTEDVKKDKALAHELMECVADTGLEVYDANAHLVVFVL